MNNDSLYLVDIIKPSLLDLINFRANDRDIGALHRRRCIY